MEQHGNEAKGKKQFLDSNKHILDACASENNTEQRKK